MKKEVAEKWVGALISGDGLKELRERTSTYTDLEASGGSYDPNTILKLLLSFEAAVKVIEQMKDHCLCDRNHLGFDYGENHKLLGKPKSGARWLTPSDLADNFLKGLKDE